MSTQAITRDDTMDVRFVTPPVDIFENQDGLFLVSDMPGVSKDSLSVKVHDHELTVVGKRGGIPEGDALHQGIPADSFQRTFSLHHNIDTENIEAKLQSGVLTVFLPKSDAVRTRDIQIQTA